MLVTFLLFAVLSVLILTNEIKVPKHDNLWTLEEINAIKRRWK